MARRHRYGNPDQNQEGIFDYARNRLGAEVRNTTALGKGFPDGVAAWRGLTVLIEVKRPGGKLRKAQADFRDTWRKIGGPYLVVDSGESLLTQLLALDRQLPPVRGLPGQIPVDDAISKALTAMQAQDKLKAEGIALPGSYVLETRAILEDMVRGLHGKTNY